VPLQSSECAACGHLFRTRFPEATDRTQAFDAVMLPRLPVRLTQDAARHRSAPSAFGVAFLTSFLLVGLLALGGWLMWGLSQRVAPVPAHTLTLAGGTAIGRAEDLYDRIAISMSLYDLDQAAGGMGRVVRSANPHTLLLSYDYPDQSVRVSLYRSDPNSEDYRVQAVALYHGRTRLQHHTEEN
jgi:hypothetical protein